MGSGVNADFEVGIEDLVFGLCEDLYSPQLREGVAFEQVQIEPVLPVPVH